MVKKKTKQKKKTSTYTVYMRFQIKRHMEIENKGIEKLFHEK